MSFKKVAALGDLWSGEKSGIHVDGKRILIINIDNVVYAYEDRCAHLGVRLSEGCLIGKMIRCPAHLWEYDACTGDGIHPPTVSLKRLETKVEGDSIFVDTGADGETLGETQ